MPEFTEVIHAADFVPSVSGLIYIKTMAGAYPSGAMPTGFVFKVTTPFTSTDGIGGPAGTGQSVIVFTNPDGQGTPMFNGPVHVDAVAEYAAMITDVIDTYVGVHPTIVFADNLSALAVPVGGVMTVSALYDLVGAITSGASLVDLATVRSAVQTDIGDPALQLMIDAAEQEIIQTYGGNYPGPVTYVKERTDYSVQNPRTVYLPRQVLTMTSVTEKWGDEINESSRVLDPLDYRILYGGWAVERIGTGPNADWLWGHRIEFVYVPVDDTKRRQSAIIELTRMSTRHSGVADQAAGDSREMSYQDYEQERQRILDSLGPRMDF